MPLTKFNIVVTNLEHDTNVTPFVRMAEDLQVGSYKPLPRILFKMFYISLAKKQNFHFIFIIFRI